MKTIQFVFLLNGLFMLGNICPMIPAFAHTCGPVNGSAPCGGQRGECVLNKDGSDGGFVAAGATVESTIIRSEYGYDIEPYNFGVGERAVVPYIAVTAQVCDSAKVSGNVRIKDNVIVGGSAVVRGRAVLSDHAKVLGNSVVMGKARISENALIFGNAQVMGNAHISGSAVVSGRAEVMDSALISGHSVVTDHARISGEVVISENVTVGGSVGIFDKVRLSGDIVVNESQQIGGNLTIDSREKLEALRDELSASSSITQRRQECLDRLSADAHRFKQCQAEETKIEFLLNELKKKIQELENCKADLYSHLEQCPVCLEALATNKHLVQSRCQHLFCQTCFSNLVSQEVKSCPMCRTRDWDVNAIHLDYPDVDSEI